MVSVERCFVAEVLMCGGIHYRELVSVKRWSYSLPVLFGRNRQYICLELLCANYGILVCHAVCANTY